MLSRLFLIGLLLGMGACGGGLSQADLDALEQLPPSERAARIEAMLADHPGDQRLTTMLGRATWETYSDLEPAAKTERLKADLRADPENAILSKLLGDAYYDLKEGAGGLTYLDSALFAYENAALKEPEYLEALGSVGALYDEKEDYDQAIYWYGRVLELEPEHVTTICNLGASHYNKGEFSKALGYYRQAMAIEPGNQDAHYNLGVAFAEAGIYREAIGEWEIVADIDSTTAVGKQARQNADLLKDVLDETLYEGGKRRRRLNMSGAKIERETQVREKPSTGHEGHDH